MVLGKKKGIVVFLRYFVLTIVGVIMVYPLLWMVSATFKSNAEIFTNMGLIPQSPILDGWKNGIATNYGGTINIITAMINTFKIVIPKVIFTVLSSTIAAYGFGRFNFKGRNLLFAVLMSTLFIPQVVLNVPQFMMYYKWGWVNSPLYLALIVPTIFAVDTYFVFMLIQFLRNVPRDLDEAAKIDGCSEVGILFRIIVPMLRPAMISCALFQFMWSSNDFLGPLLYVNSPALYPASIFVKMSMDADTGFEWNRILAVSLVSIVPSLIIFFSCQKEFVEGISAGSVKG